MPKATLINSEGKKVVVESGSPEAQQFFGQGYQLMGPDGKPVPRAGDPEPREFTPPPAGATPPAEPEAPAEENDSPIDSGVFRFPTLEGEGGRNEEAEYYGNLDLTAPTETEQQDIREKFRQQVQPLLDDIEKTFGFRLAEEALQGKGTVGSSRAIASRGAGLGSPRGQAQIAGANKRVADIRAATLAEQQAAINAVYDKVDERTEARIKAETDLAKSNAEAYLTFLTNQRAEAKDNIISLAQQGVSLSDIDDELRNKLLDQSDLDPLIFETLYNANLPKENQIDYKIENLGGGQILFYGQDPATGELYQQKFDYSLPEGENIQILDGVPYGAKEDEQGNLVLRKLPGYEKPEGVPETRLVNGNLYQYNSETKQWDIVIKKAVAGTKPITLTKDESVKWFGTLEYAGKRLDQIPTDILPREEPGSEWEYKEGVRAGFREDKGAGMDLQGALDSYGPTLGVDFVYQQYGQKPPSDERSTQKDIYEETFYGNLAKGLIPVYDKSGQFVVEWKQP